MPYVHHVAILHDVVLTFESERALGARIGFRSRLQQLIPTNRFGADEVFLQIGVNRARSFLRRACSLESATPGTRLHQQ